MRRIKRTASAALLALCAASCAGNTAGTNTAPANAPAGSNEGAAPKPTPSRIVSAEVSPVEVSAGGEAEAVVRLRVAEGYHVNANPASDRLLIPTTLTVTPAEGITAGAPSYPAGQTKSFPFSEQPLAVYEGDVPLRVVLRARRDAARGAHSLPAKIRVQACDDEKCFPPTDLNSSIQVTVN